MILGIIDVGTNSIHLLVGIVGRNGRFRAIRHERELARLGEGGLARGRLTDAAMRRAMSVLRRYVLIAKRCHVTQIEAVATSAVREAANGRVFVRRVRARLGLRLRIISGREEARLIYLGVLQAHGVRRAAVIVTIGGGSSQVAQGNGKRLGYATSVPLGAARLAQRFVRHDPPRPEEIAALYRATRKVWAPVARALRRRRWQSALGSSATIYQLMLAAALRSHRHPPRAKRPLSVTQRTLRELVDWLASSTAAQRLRLAGLDPRREDLALPTAIALLTWMEACGVTTVHYADGSIREGLVFNHGLRPGRLVLSDRRAYTAGGHNGTTS